MTLAPRSSMAVLAWIVFTLTAFSQVDTLTILHVNDTHSNLAPIGPRSGSLAGSLGGIARAASLIGMEKATNPNPLLLHAGDAFVGDLFYNVYFGVPELQIMSALGFDAMAVGNHEFDLAPSTLYGALQSAFSEGGAFPLLSANLVLDDPAVDSLKLYISSFVVRDVGGIKVGLFGMTTPSTNQISNPLPAVVDTNIIPIGAAMVDSLTALGCDVILCLSHMGFTLDALLASYVPGIHGIVGGHDHYLFPDPVFIENPGGDSTWIVQASSFYLNLGKLRITVNGSTVQFLDYEMLPIDDSIPEESSTLATVEQLIAGIEGTYGQPFYTQQVGFVGKYLEEFDAAPLEYGNKDTPLGNLITDVFRSVTGADIAIEANGSIAQPLYAGPIVAADVYRSVGYGFNEDNFLGFRLVTFDISGAALLGGMEYGLSTLVFNDDFLLQVSGMSYVFNPALPEFGRLIEVNIGGAPLDPGAIYTIAANEFVPLFLDVLEVPYENLHVYTDTTEFQILLDYIGSVDTVDANIEGRVRAADTVVVGVHSMTHAGPQYFELFQNYPNPFNPSTTIRFSIPEAGRVTLFVFTMLGQLVATLVDDQHAPGTYEIKWNAAGLPSGTYFYRLQTGAHNEVKKFLLLK